MNISLESFGHEVRLTKGGGYGMKVAAANLIEASKVGGISGRSGKPHPIGRMALGLGAEAVEGRGRGLRVVGRLAETGSANCKGCGFRMVRVAEREDCPAVWNLRR